MAGRPRREFTEEQEKEILDLAYTGCKTNTIASITGISETTLTSNFRELMTQKRAERKRDLRKAQNRLCSEGDKTMLIFIGKNDLEQSDKRETKHDVTETFAAAMASMLDKRSKNE